ncbi:hypothetical protein ACFXTO_019694 [Malus domestica]
MGLQRPSLLRSFRFALSIYFFFPTACIQTKRGKEKKEKKKSHGKRVKGKRFCYGLLGEKKMEYLGQARTAVIDGSKGEMGDLENNFMGAAFKLGLQLYDEILRIGFDPDLFTYTALIRGHCVRGDMKEAEELFTKIHKSGLPIDHVPYRIFFKEYC